MPKNAVHDRVLVFVYAGRITDHGLLGYFSGILLNEIPYEYIFLALSWSSHKYKRRIKITGTAEILATGESIEAVKVLWYYPQVLLNTKIELLISVDKK